jgi:Fur family transcriptional regulator, ferric uptake regulator
MERSTRQRAAIVSAMERERRPLSPVEILVRAQADVPGLGTATVYRTLKALVADGVVVSVDLPGEPPRYEPAGAKHHHHFRCHVCDRVFEVPGCAKGIRALVPRGFELDGHELVLYGRCRGCVAA